MRIPSPRSSDLPGFSFLPVTIQSVAAGRETPLESETRPFPTINYTPP